MVDLAKIRQRMGQKDREKNDRRESGRLGEIIIEAWLREVCRFDVEPLPQDFGTKRLLLKEGGKRPDFAVDIDSEVVLVDAKLQSTDDLRGFGLDSKEVDEFRLAMKELDIEHLFIALIPRERVDCLFLIHLDDIEYKNNFGPMNYFTKFDRSGNDRYFGPITEKAYSEAERRFRSEGYRGDIPPYPTD